MDDTVQPRTIDLIGGAILIGASYYIYRSIDYVLNEYFTNDSDFPPGTTRFHHPFGESLDVACQISANGVFSFLTGISCNELDALGYNHNNHAFDREKKVHMSDISGLHGKIVQSRLDSFQIHTFMHLFIMMVTYINHIVQNEIGGLHLLMHIHWFV